MVIVGGGDQLENNDDVFSTLFTLMLSAKQQHTNPTSDDMLLLLSVVTAASSDPKDSAARYLSMFDKRFTDLKAKLPNLHQYMLNIEWLPIDVDHPERNRDPVLLDIAKKSHAVFFGQEGAADTGAGARSTDAAESGAGQDRLIKCFMDIDKEEKRRQHRVDSPILALIRDRYTRGQLVIAGAGAGAAVLQGTPMVNGGWSYDSLLHGPHDSRDPQHPEYLSADTLGGFGLFGSGYLDTHVGEQGRQGRLVRLMVAASNNQRRRLLLAKRPLTIKNELSSTVGYGIDENTALVVSVSVNDTDDDSDTAEMSVVGAGGMFVFNVAHAQINTTTGDIGNVTVSYLTPGDAFMPAKGALRPASWKSSLAGQESRDSPVTSSDIFNSPRGSPSDATSAAQFTEVATGLFDAKEGKSVTSSTFETTPKFSVVMTKDAIRGCAAYVGIRDQVRYISFTNLRVDMIRT